MPEELVIENFRLKMNELGASQTPFLFLIDYELQKPHIWEISEIDPASILYDIEGVSNFPVASNPTKAPFFFEKFPIAYSDYQVAFEKVQQAIRMGDTYLANLTFATKVLTSLSLREIIIRAKAPYRFFWKDKCAFFSPESFIKIKNQRIMSYPMKGTLRAETPNAEASLLADPKEKAEHATITDLIRNDLSRVAERVRVERYRYVEKIEHHGGELLQTSTEIVGDLPVNYKDHLGDILMKLLPAGSISGAPKARTVEVLAGAEEGPRGYYTGIVGYFDGENLDSAVAIRFLEEKGGNLWYRSGGGLTHFSQAQAEYEELIEKVYLPFSRKNKPLSTY